MALPSTGKFRSEVGGSIGFSDAIGEHHASRLLCVWCPSSQFPPKSMAHPSGLYVRSTNVEHNQGCILFLINGFHLMIQLVKGGTLIRYFPRSCGLGRSAERGHQNRKDEEAREREGVSISHFPQPVRIDQFATWPILFGSIAEKAQRFLWLLLA